MIKIKYKLPTGSGSAMYLSEIERGEADKVIFILPGITRGSLNLGGEKYKITDGKCELDYSLVADKLFSPKAISSGKEYTSPLLEARSGCIRLAPADERSYAECLRELFLLSEKVTELDMQIKAVQKVVSGHELFQFITSKKG